MKFASTLLVFLAFMVSGKFASANNNLFLSGDAFVPTTLTSEAVDSLNSAPEQFRFEYSSFGGYKGAFCGYAGYRYAKVDGVNKAFAAI